MEGLLSGVGIGLSIIALLCGVFLLLLFDLSVAMVAKRISDWRWSRWPKTISFSLQESSVNQPESGVSVPENNKMQRTSPD